MTSNQSSKLLIAMALVVFLTVFVRTAWVCDDAYISFRSVDNLVHGYGLRWNVDERVQGFTNPLWVFLVAACYAVTREMYFTVIVLSIVVTLLALTILARRVALNTTNVLLGMSILLFSKAFIDYSTSGLENPLIYLLVVMFSALLFGGEMDDRRLFRLSLVASLCTFNRMDTVLLFMPVLAWALWRLRTWRSLRMVILGFIPFITWELFSLYYYGFPFPNTFYAKTATGIPQAELLRQGLVYLLDSACFDPPTLMAIAMSVIVAMWSKKGRYITPALGILLYLLYTVKVGGDFMSGRFLAAPLVVGIAVLTHATEPISTRAAAVMAAVILAIGFTSPKPPILSRQNYGTTGEGFIRDTGMADERGWYFQQTGLLQARRGIEMPNHEWAQRGREYRLRGDTFGYESCVGFCGFYAGPKVHIFDSYCLTEPLLARIPTFAIKNWRIGHFPRTIPWGYDQSVRSDTNMIKDSGVAAYCEKLWLITRGRLERWERLKTIFKFNLGSYDTLLKAYTHPQVLDVGLAAASVPKLAGTAWNTAGNFILGGAGMRVELDSVSHVQRIELSIDQNDNYIVSFLRDSTELGWRQFDRKFTDQGGLRIDTVEVPSAAHLAGYNFIRVIPLPGDDLYGVGHVRLLSP